MLDDKTTKIFLNTKGTKDDIPAPLKNFLKYMDDGSVTDDFTREIDEAVNEVRRDKKWRKKIMTVEQLIKDEAKLAHKKGFSEGEAKGKAEGINLINDLHNRLLKDKRYDDLEKSTVDKDYQNQLLAEYGLK